MVFLVTAFGLLVHVLFWGAGVALLTVPRRWRAFWPVFAGVAGLTLQSAVVWGGAYLDLVGTRAYAWPAELVPLVLLGLAVCRHGLRTWRSVPRFAGLALAIAVTLGALVWPWVMGAKELTSMSIGSCDAADYAAGARVFQEFARSDRSGFLGLAEVVTVGSADNFFDFWLRLNHFTPSALMALNGTILGLQPHQIVSVFTAVCLVLAMPLVFWVARAGFHYGPAVSLSIALLYGINPINWYAVYHVATAQLLAVNAIALVTWAGVAAWRRGATGWGGASLTGVLAIGYGLIWGSYNFIIVVALVPAVAYVGALTLWTGAWWRALRWSVVMLVPMVVSGLFFWERVAGLIERITLFQRFDFGWRIPALSPEGWLGAVSTSGLEGFSPWARVVLSVLVLGLLFAAVSRGLRRRDSRVWLVASFSVPILVGYAFLQVRGALRGTNASYDAYKLFSVFYPGLLASLAYGVTLFSARVRLVRWILGATTVLVVALDVQAARALSRHMRKLPLVVDPALVSVQTIERRPEVQSVNMLIPDMWSRLWANVFLLRKPQYFPTHTYEGRLNTELKARWDLTSGVIAVRLPAPRATGNGSREPAAAPALQAPYTLVDTTARAYVRANFGDGWYDLERLSRPPTRWRWSHGDAALRIENSHAYPLTVALQLDARSLVDRDLQIWSGGRLLHTVHVGEERTVVSIPRIEVPSGVTLLQLRSSKPPISPGGGDGRSLGIAVYRIEMNVRPATADS